MIHLFNNVFLEQDTFVDQRCKHVLISARYATPNTISLSTAISVGTTLQVVLAGKTLGEFLKSLMTHGSDKVMIYADNVAFATIATTWLKSSTNMDKKSFNVFADCYKHKCDVYSRSNNQLIEFMKESWASTVDFDFSTDDFTPSFEFGLASAFVNRNFNKKEKFKATLSKFIKREYEHLILEARKHLDTYILDKDLQEILGGSGKTLQNYRELPRMSIYREPFFRDTVNNVPSPHAYWPGKVSKLDIKNATDAEVIELCTLTDDINMAVMNCTVPAGLSGSVNIKSTPGWIYIASVKNGVLSDAEYNLAIDEILAEKIAMVHVPFDLREQILFAFLPYLKTLKQENNTSVLGKFTLK